MLVFALFIVKHILFFGNGCKIFGVFFNIESALAVHQLPIRWQIFNSRGGSFGLKLALACKVKQADLPYKNALSCRMEGNSRQKRCN